MKTDDFKLMLDDFGTFLTDLERLMGKAETPRTVEELISFLASTASHPWQVQLLHGSLEKLKQTPVRR